VPGDEIRDSDLPKEEELAEFFNQKERLNG